MISVSKAAVERIYEIIAEEGNTDLAFRISVVGGGCSGFKYKFSIVDPTFQYSLPADQTAFGIADAFSHVLEIYLNNSKNDPV